MAVNNYLIIGVTPTNNETNVSLNTDITITFAKYMDATTLTSANLILQEVNGDIIPCSISYNSDTMTVTMIPNADSQVGMVQDALQPGASYLLTVVGSAAGIKELTGDYMSVSRTYTFTTAFVTGLSAPQSVAVTVNNGFPVVTWEQPAQFDVANPLTYDVVISASNITSQDPTQDPTQTAVWPSKGDINTTGTTVLNVPKQLTGDNYYAYVRAKGGGEVSDWAFAQFFVQTDASAPASQPSDPYGNPYGSSPGSTGVINQSSFSFDVADTYPRRDDADVMPEQIVIVFSSDVDPTTVDSNSVYIVQKKDKANLSLVDFMTEYAPSKAVTPTSAPTVAGNVITLAATLSNDSEYTVIIRESVKNVSGTSLGIAYHWSFLTTYTVLYGDVEKVREDLGVWGKNATDKVLYNYLEDSTLYINQLLPSMQNYDAKKYVNGAAPYEVHEYVRYRAAYDALLNSNMRLGGGGFSQSVGLGDLHVTKGVNDSVLTITGILTQLKDKMRLYMDLIEGLHNRGYAKPQTVSKGEVVEAYPSYMTRDTYKMIG